MKIFQYFKSMLQDYKIGAVTATSTHASQIIAQCIPSGVDCIVEYGAGDGVATQHLIGRLGKEGMYLAIEQNEELYGELGKMTDTRLKPIHGDVVHLSQNLAQFAGRPIDAVISSIPFSFLSPETREEVVLNTAANLNKNGRIIVYQYTTLLQPLLEKYFSSVEVTRTWKNFPPYYIMVARK